MADWIQDFDEAKKQAADGHKNVLIVFDASDAPASKFASSRFNESVASMKDFIDRADKEYVCVYIDNPAGDEAKKKVRDLARNQNLTKRFRIAVFPTVVVTAPDAHPFGIMEDYKINGVIPFLELMDKWQEDRATLFPLLARIGAAEKPDPKLLKQAISFLRLNKLDRIYRNTIENWSPHIPAGEIDEVTQQEGELWLQKLAMATSNPDQVKKIVDEFDEWKKGRTFKNRDMGAGLHLAAAIVLARIGMRAEAAQKCKEGLAYGPRDPALGVPVGAVQGSLDRRIGRTPNPACRIRHRLLYRRRQLCPYEPPRHRRSEEDHGAFERRREEIPGATGRGQSRGRHGRIENRHARRQQPRALPLAAKDAAIGDEVCTFGWPGLLNDNPTSTLTKGVVSTIHREEGFLVTDCKIEHGNSGGPLCSVSGCCIAGMVTAKTATRQGLNESYGLAIPVSKLRKFLMENLPAAVRDKLPPPSAASGGKLSDLVKLIQPLTVYVENYQ